MKITKNYSHDNMSLSVKLPTGGSMKFSVGRSGERLEVCFSNDDNELMGQTNSVKLYMKLMEGETNQGRFDRLESLLRAQGGCKSGRTVVSRMRYEMSVVPRVITVK
jgi:hypothetical protein